MNKVKCRALAQIERSEEQGDELVIFGEASAANLDRKGTFIDQDALWDAAKRYTHRTLFLNHDWHAAIGTVPTLSRGKDSLLAEGHIGKDFEVPVGVGLGAVLWNVNNLRAQIRQGIVRSYSIGFEGTRHEDPNGGPPTIKPTDLLDISVVTLPANHRTLFGFARSMMIEDGEDWPTWPGELRGRSTLDAICIRDNTITGKISPVRFEFANEEPDDEELYLKAALRSLQEAVADWK